MMTVCGVFCSECSLYEKECQGCVEGKPFWAVDFIEEEDKTCPLYKCSMERKYPNCGKCDELPCQKWRDVKDPSISEEAHLQSINERVAVLWKNVKPPA